MGLTALQSFLFGALEIMVAGIVLLLGLAVIAIVAIYIHDVTQTRHAILRNYPVIGHFRYLFEHLGEFFRQYFFAMDREELPFNRAQRAWCYRAARHWMKMPLSRDRSRLDPIAGRPIPLLRSLIFPA
jgi:hypothetical protein